MKSFEHQCLDFWRSKPADEEYAADELHKCALAQFVDTLGATGRGDLWWKDAGGEHHRYDQRLYNAAIGVGSRSWTFGAAAARLEKLLQP